MCDLLAVAWGPAFVLVVFFVRVVVAGVDSFGIADANKSIRLF